jgi:hypothetical protein
VHPTLQGLYTRLERATNALSAVEIADPAFAEVRFRLLEDARRNLVIIADAVLDDSGEKFSKDLEGKLADMQPLVDPELFEISRRISDSDFYRRQRQAVERQFGRAPRNLPILILNKEPIVGLQGTMTEYAIFLSRLPEQAGLSHTLVHELIHTLFPFPFGDRFSNFRWCSDEDQDAYRILNEGSVETLALTLSEPGPLEQGFAYHAACVNVMAELAGRLEIEPRTLALETLASGDVIAFAAGKLGVSEATFKRQADKLYMEHFQILERDQPELIALDLSSVVPPAKASDDIELD